MMNESTKAALSATDILELGASDPTLAQCDRDALNTAIVRLAAANDALKDILRRIDRTGKFNVK